jgi:hypothetical protein
VTAPSFNINGTNAAKNATATFYAAGSYTFQVTFTDTSSLSVTSSVSVTVNQTLTSIGVSPSSVTLPNSSTQQCTARALDQFGAAMASQPGFTWSIDGGGMGTVSGAGLYTAPSSGTGTATVRATISSMSGTASVTVATIPAAPSNLTATVVSGTQVNLAWVDNSSNETGLTIQRSSNGGSSWTQIATVGQSITAYSDNTVSKRKTYQYRVAAYNATGTSAWSNVITATTPSKTPQRTAITYPAPDVPDHGNVEEHDKKPTIIHKAPRFKPTPPFFHHNRRPGVGRRHGAWA